MLSSVNPAARSSSGRLAGAVGAKHLGADVLGVALAVVPPVGLKAAAGDAVAKVGAAVEVPLAGVGGAVAIVAKDGAHQGDGGVGGDVVAPGAIDRGMGAGEQAAAGGRAERAGGVGALKADAGLGQAVEVGGVHGAAGRRTRRPSICFGCRS